MRVTEDVSQLDTSLLKILAPENMQNMLVTDDVFQLDELPLNKSAFQDISGMFVREEVSHPEISLSKAPVLLNM